MVDKVNRFLDELTPIQEHFLKKFLLQHRLETELSLFTDPKCLRLFGAPFKAYSDYDNNLFPLTRFFFTNYIESFPFITNNDPEAQRQFWQDVVQAFVESLNSKTLSNSRDRKDNVTKRHQVSVKIARGLLLFYNSMIVTDKDLEYLESDHLKPSDTGKLDKLKVNSHVDISKNDFEVDIIGVKEVNGNSSTWFSRNNSHYEFLIKVTTDNKTHYVYRPYYQFKQLDKQMKQEFPGIISKDNIVVPEKFKQDVKNLVKEKLRLGLRGYLRQLLKYTEITKSKEMIEFLYNDKFITLSQQQQIDCDQRQRHEKRVLATQLEFQKQVSSLMMNLSQQFDDFKHQLINEPKTLENIFKEIGTKSDITNLSPLLTVFIDWCKIELSATIFEVFFSQDNSNEMLNKLVRFHKMFPYRLVYNILRFTNPMSMISRLINLLLATFPGTNKSLLSIMFVMLLNEDLSGYDNEIQAVNEKLQAYPNFVEAVEQFVGDKTTDDTLDTIEDFQQILNHSNSLTKEETRFLSKPSEQVFNNLKQLYQLKIRQNDKLMMKSLWQEPELTRLLKQFLIIFYQPLIRLMSRSKLHVFFKSFQIFMNELIELLVELNQQVYYLSPIEIFNKLMQLMNDHIVIFWQFVHNLYNNDQEQLFLKIVQWVENFLIKLRLKYIDKQKVTISIGTTVDINQQLFMTQLDAVINKTVAKRRLFNSYYKTESPSVASKWDELHQPLYAYDQQLGLNIDDLQEFNFDVTKTDLEFQKRVNELDQVECDTSELEKLDDHLVHQLSQILDTFDH